MALGVGMWVIGYELFTRGVERGVLENWGYVYKILRRVLFIVRAGVAKNTKIQCTRMKLLIQPAILPICQKSINSF